MQLEGCVLEANDSAQKAKIQQTGAEERAIDIETSQGDEPWETCTVGTKGRSCVWAERKET